MKKVRFSLILLLFRFVCCYCCFVSFRFKFFTRNEPFNIEEAKDTDYTNSLQSERRTKDNDKKTTSKVSDKMTLVGRRTETTKMKSKAHFKSRSWLESFQREDDTFSLRVSEIDHHIQEP